MSTLTATLMPPAIRNCRPRLMVATLVCSDALSVAVAFAFALWTEALFQDQARVSIPSYWPLLILYCAAFALVGLYSGLPISAPEELKRTTLACLVVGIGTVFSRPLLNEHQTQLNSIPVLTYVLTLLCVPILRHYARSVCCKHSWWGYPAVVFGDLSFGTHLIKTCLEDQLLGLKPIAFVLAQEANVTSIEGVPVIQESDLPRLAPYLQGRGYALFSGSNYATSSTIATIREFRSLLPHILVVPEHWELASLRVTPKNVGGILGLEIREHSPHAVNRILKRMFDVVFSLVAIVIGFPVLLAILLAIRIDSPGPIFFGHRRIGRAGEEFVAWKFRSMVDDAEQQLERHLQANTEMRSEWANTCKLREDPRVTRVGRLLRRTSFDEVPQLWNVLKGEMSLVGPRPIVRAEIPRYGEYFELYAQVPGGLTGLWQVSGRSNTSYERRVSLDIFYIRNWSFWLDICIIFRTLASVWSRMGAY